MDGEGDWKSVMYLGAVVCTASQWVADRSVWHNGHLGFANVHLEE